ncbi:MAG: MFS transporter [Candidatus Heimdallarchaeaceae archaeon]|jgi:MFS family permease
MTEKSNVIESESSYKEVFKNKEFVKLLTGQIFSNFGDAVFRIAIVLYVYSLTGSAAQMTLVLAAQTLPWILIGPITGVLADRISRKTIMVSADLLRAASVIAIPFIHSLYPLLVIAFIDGVGSSSFAAPRSAAIPEIVGLKVYVKAISLSRLIFQTFAVLGPLIAAPVYAFFGTPTFWITSGCYVLSAVVIFRTMIPSASREKEPLTVKTIYGDLKEGLVYLFKHPIIKVLLVLFTFVVIGSAFAGPLLYPWIFEVRHGGDILLEQMAQTEYGIIGAIIAFGTVAGNILFGKYEKKIGRSRAIIFGTASLVVYYLIFQFTPSIYLIGVFGLMMGTLNGMANLSINAYFAEEVPNEVRGRAYSATNAFIQVFSVTCLSISGLTAESIGIANTMLMASAIILVGLVFLSIRTKLFKFTPKPVSATPAVGD